MAAYDSDDIKVLFSLFDADQNGKLGKKEVKELIELVTGERSTEDDQAKFMQFIDTNKDDVITIDEFEVLVTKYFPMTPLGVRNLFKTFDSNGDGFVDKDEFNQVIKGKADNLDERKINFFKKVFTRDDSDKVSYEQFIDSATKHYRDYVANRNN
ncbi:unnamed protein product [Adineta steineri]|uniref:EF-hand domain-containing protein n=1 Tax=Adineta steineri TaxID=433720 RepID=A0A813WDV6_9BILA|nr:unnamed protein product [Adineta steineri]CAF3913486.1 unnamed protein product [Adineta steineri]CAF4033397.1 unnamed protein product [Adineta steineri]